MGATFLHGRLSGAFCFESFAPLPQSKSQTRGCSLTEQTTAHRLAGQKGSRQESERFLGFVWRVAGRPEGGEANWQREGKLTDGLDNDAVPKSQRVGEERAALSRAGVGFFSLAASGPELSPMEPVWQEGKDRELLPRRSQWGRWEASGRGRSLLASGSAPLVRP
ncbi:MAG: hypothetical protein C4321_08925 [Chloroflexota bacterium]